MADKDTGVVQHDAAVGEHASPAVARDNDTETWDLDHEEKSRRIAEEDLNRKKKQVDCSLSVCHAAFPPVTNLL